MSNLLEWPRQIYQKLRPIFSILSEEFKKFTLSLKKFTLSSSKPWMIQFVFSLLILSTLIGGRTSAIDGPFDGNALLLFILVCVITIAIGNYFSDSWTYDRNRVVLLFGIQIILIFIYVFSTFQSYAGWTELFTVSLGISSVAVIGLLSGIISGHMMKPAWMGDRLFMDHIKKAMEEEDMHLLHCSVEGKMKLIPPSLISVVWVDDIQKVFFGNQEDVLSNYTPVHLSKSNFDSKLVVEPAITSFSAIFAQLPVAWRDTMSDHYQSLSDGHQRISWIFHLLRILPYSPSSLALRSELIQYSSSSVTIEMRGEKSPIKINLQWPVPENNFQVDFPEHEYHDCAIHTVLGNDHPKSQPLEIEQEIISEIFPRLASEKLSHAAIYFLRSFTHLMIRLREEFSNNEGVKSEMCRLTIADMTEWFSSLNLEGEIFPSQSHESYAMLPSNVIPIEVWSRVIKDSITQPTTIFLRLHDRIVPFIEGDDFEIRKKRKFESVVSESIELAMQTSTHLPDDRDSFGSEWVGVGIKHNLSINRKSALLTGICKLLLLVSLYEEPAKGVV